MSESIGPHIDGDPRGWLRFQWLSRDLERSEDQTLHADHQGVEEDALLPYTFTRPATDTERILLAHIGHTLPADLETTVCWLSVGVRNRRWPSLEGS